MREAEGRLSQNLGNLNMIIVGGKNSAERTAMWMILKARYTLPFLTHRP
jgi:hypothetical protein